MAPERAGKKKKLAPMNNFVYDLFLWIFSIVVELFFREIHPRSSWKIPRKGPVIFVAAPHANQVNMVNVSLCALKLTGDIVCRSSHPYARRP